MSNLSDVVGGANMSVVSSSSSYFSFAKDRFCNASSAIFFNNGSGLKVPSGIYFSGDFTVNAWINLKANNTPYNMRLIDFGQGNYNEWISIQIGSLKITFNSKINSTSGSGIATNSFIELNKWYHVTVTLNGTTGRIYVNGSLVVTGQLKAPRNVLRTENRIGNVNALAVYDDLKIYQRAMSPEQVLYDYIVSSNNGIYFLFFEIIFYN